MANPDATKLHLGIEAFTRDEAREELKPNLRVLLQPSLTTLLTLKTLLLLETDSEDTDLAGSKAPTYLSSRFAGK